MQNLRVIIGDLTLIDHPLKKVIVHTLNNLGDEYKEIVIII